MSKNKTKPYKTKKEKNYFPNNLRFITDNFILKFAHRKRRTLLIFFSIFLILLAIVVVGWDGYNNYQDNKRFREERAKIEKEISFWYSIAERFPNYRDAYFELAILNYRIRKYEEAKEQLEKALRLDPNFKEGRKLEEKMNN